jgi:AcrR family transcriptional regulator
MAAGGRPLSKGRQTRAAILEAAVALASQRGIEGLSIGGLSDAAGMSKSGVFAHFGSREELQIAVLHDYSARFKEEVFDAAMHEARGLPRLRCLFDRWLRRVSAEVDAGCLYISGAVEFDDRPGPVRDALAEMVRAWQGALQRAVAMTVDEHHFRPDTDPAQVVFEMQALVFALHHDARFLRTPGVAGRARAAFERLALHHATPAGRRLLPVAASAVRNARR